MLLVLIQQHLSKSYFSQTNTPKEREKSRSLINQNKNYYIERNMACIITRAISSKKEKKFNHRRTRILSVIDNEIKKNSRGKSSVGQNRYTVGKQGENSRENRFFESTSSFY